MFVILVGIVLVLELYWNCWFGCVYCIGIGPRRPVLFNCGFFFLKLTSQTFLFWNFYLLKEKKLNLCFKTWKIKMKCFLFFNACSLLIFDFSTISDRILLKNLPENWWSFIIWKDLWFSCYHLCNGVTIIW
jgi:hypothetical protein